MTPKFTAVTLGLTSVVAFLVGLIVAGTLTPTPAVSSVPRVPAVAASPNVAAVPAPAVGGVNFADVVSRVNPSVVNIEATSRGQGRRPSLGPLRGPLGGDVPEREPRDTPRRGAGSGFIIDAEGDILTNYHVVKGAERLTVKLADGRTVHARTVGTDADTDIALIRVDGVDRLPRAVLGNSDALRVGEWVCAIGNPLAYEHTVTVGVVSYIGRKLFDPSLDNYIQTDAAINFGNSGGPLINTRGEVIGINAAISSRASNIGFAVPINQATSILGQLRKYGRVHRGYIGVRLRELDPDLLQSLKLGAVEGALVEDVPEGTPAERAGLRTYDVIQAVDEHRVETNEDLIRTVAAREPGSLSRLRVLRDGRQRTVVVKLAERTRTAGESADDRPDAPRPSDGSRAGAGAIGLTVRPLERDIANRLGIPKGLSGVLVAQVEGLSPAYDADIERGNVIMEINRQTVRSMADYQRITGLTRPGDPLTFYVFVPGLNQRGLRTLRVEAP
jgi:serine protease Do